MPWNSFSNSVYYSTVKCDYFRPHWLGRVSFSGEMGRLIFLPMLAWKGFLLRGSMGSISIHIGWNGYPSLGRRAGRYFCPCWLGRVSFCRKVDRLIFLPKLAGKDVLLWEPAQVDIAAHVGSEGCPSLERWAGQVDNSAQHLLRSFSKSYNFGGKFHLWRAPGNTAATFP